MKGMVCTRSSSNIYMLSLLVFDHRPQGQRSGGADGPRACGTYRARDPAGGDTDQLRGIASGECAVSVSNTYYFARALRKDVKGLDDDAMSRIGWVFPNQGSTGAHANISGAGVAKHAPNKENATSSSSSISPATRRRSTSPPATTNIPAVMGVGLSDSVAQLGIFRSDTLNLSALGENQPEARKIYDRAGYQ